MKSLFKQAWNGIEGINGFVLILYIVFVYFTGAVVSGRGSAIYWFIALLVGGLVGVFICPAVIRLLSKVSISVKTEKKHKKKYTPMAIKGCLFFLSLGVFLLYYSCVYPGFFSSDSFVQYEQAMSNRYNDWHPVMHTLIAFKLPLLLTGGWKGSIVLFQILCFSAVVSYSLWVILECTNLRFTICSMCFILLNPQTITIAMYPWKDVAFAIGALLVLTYALRIFVTRGIWLKKPLHLVLFVLATVLTTLFRHNAILFTAPLVLAVLLQINPKRGLILCMGIVMLYGVIKIPLYTALNVESPDQRQVETLGFPMTIIGAAVVSCPEELDAEILDFAYKVAPEEVWKEKYSFRTFNNVKWDERTDINVVEEYGAVKVLTMMVKCCKTAKLPALKSLIRLTNSIYSISDRSIDFYAPSVGAHRHGGIILLGTLLANYCHFISDNFYFMFNLGFVHLIILISALSKCRLNRLKDWKKLLFVIPMFAYNYGTTLLLTGAEDAVRFFFYTALILPILLVFIYSKDTERTREDNV